MQESSWKKRQQNFFDSDHKDSSKKDPTSLFNDYCRGFLEADVLELTRRHRLVCDLGCGEGEFLPTICKNWSAREYKFFIAVDISLKSLRKAKRKIKDFQKIDFILCDVENLPFRSNTFDLVLMIDILHHLSSLRILEDIREILNNDGEILLNDHVIQNPLVILFSFFFKILPQRMKKQISLYDFREGEPTPTLYYNLYTLTEHLDNLNFRLVKEDFPPFYVFLIPLVTRLLPWTHKFIGTSLFQFRFLRQLYLLEQSLMKYLPPLVPKYHMRSIYRLKKTKATYLENRTEEYGNDF